MHDVYPRFFDLKRRIIEPVCKEITTKTNLKVDWEPEKEGRAVIGVWFHIREKIQMNLPLDTIDMDSLKKIAQIKDS